jgi:Zn-finger nucleic acid-binding protein
MGSPACGFRGSPKLSSNFTKNCSYCCSVSFRLYLENWPFTFHILWGYNEPMLCPNDSTEMHQVKIIGHYGGPIFVDQCEKCGGIWFDESELFRAKQGEAEKIEVLDAGILRTPSAIENSTLFCPRGGAKMHRFTDRYFPQDIVLVRCPLCHGIWLNRGMFTKYQQFRQELMSSKKISLQDKKLEERVGQLVESYESGHSTETLRGLGEFLSTPIDSGYTRDFGYTPAVGGVADASGIAGFALTGLLTILRFFIFRS